MASDYADESNAGRIVGVVGFFHLLALTFVALRIYARVAMIKAFGTDDVLILFASTLALTSWICLIVQIPYGLGRHGSTISQAKRTKFEHISFWKTVLSDGFAMGFLRLSLAFSLLRLNRDLKWYRWSLYAVIAFVVIYTIQAVAWLFVYCTPFSGWWEFQWINPFDPRCHKFSVFIDLTYWNIACNIITDVLLGALPVPIIWNLKMPLRVRLYVIGILNLGYCSVLMGVLKAVFMLMTAGSPDITFDYWVHFWQNLQLNIGIIASCASFLKPLVGRVLKINSSAGYYPSNQRYDRSGRAANGGARSSRNAYGTGRSQADNLESSAHDEFELYTRKGFHVGESEVSPVDTKVHGGPSRQAMQGGSSSDVINSFGATSDANSEEMILQKPEPAKGIVMTRDVTVKYTVE